MRPCLLLLLLLPVQALAQRAPLVAAKVYVSGNGERATVAWLTPASDERCVLLISGTTSEVDGLVFPCATVNNSRRIDWLVTRQGRERTLLQTMPDGSAVLYAERFQIHLRFSDAETQKLDVEALWARHQKDKAACAAVARFDRAKETAEAQQEVAQSARATDAACGTKLQVSFDVAAMADEDFKAASVSSYCVQVLEQLRTFCGDWKVARETVAQRLKGVQCVYRAGARTPLSVDGALLKLTWDEHSPSETWSVETLLSEAL